MSLGLAYGSRGGITEWQRRRRQRHLPSRPFFQHASGWKAASLLLLYIYRPLVYQRPRRSRVLSRRQGKAGLLSGACTITSVLWTNIATKSHVNPKVRQYLFFRFFGRGQGKTG